MKKFFQVLIGFVVIVFVIYKCGSCIMNATAEAADEEFMKGIWVAGYGKSEKIDDFTYNTMYHITFYFFNNGSLGYDMYQYDADMNIPQTHIIAWWTESFEKVTAMAQNQNNKNTWEIKNGKLILTINGKQYKSHGKVTKSHIFHIRSLVLKDAYGDNLKLKVNFLQFMNKNGKIDYSNNPIAKSMEEFMFGDLGIY